MNKSHEQSIDLAKASWGMSKEILHFMSIIHILWLKLRKMEKGDL